MENVHKPGDICPQCHSGTLHLETETFDYCTIKSLVCDGLVSPNSDLKPLEACKYSELIAD